MFPVPARLLAIVAVVAAVILGGMAVQPPSGTHAAAPNVTTEVDQSPPAGSAVAPGTVVTYTVTVTLATGQTDALTIQMTGDSDISDRALVCTSSSNGGADTVGPGGGPSCMWNGPLVTGTFTFTFSGKANGPIGSLLTGSVVCTDMNSSNTCNDEAAGDRVALTDSDGDVGPIATIDPPSAMSEVDQAPAGPGTVAHGTVVTYTVTAGIGGTMAAPLTIQMKGDPDLTNRTLTCTSTTNGPADVVGAGGAPSCMWNAPVMAGLFTFVLSGEATGAIDDAVPAADSVACSDMNASNFCDDEVAGNRVALADTDGDVGPLNIAPPPDLTSEVEQAPPGGTVIANGVHVVYTVTVTLATAQSEALTIQLRGDGNLANRTLTCTSTTNGAADVTGTGGAPTCMWDGPLATGVFTMVFEGDATGSVGDAIPSNLSVVCTDINASNSCTDETPFYSVPLTDADGDVGPLNFQSVFKVVLPMVTKG